MLRGDLTHLHCNGVLIPCDKNWELIWDYWYPLLSLDDFEFSRTWGVKNLKGARLKGSPEKRRFRDIRSTAEGRRVRLVTTANGIGDATWVAEGVAQAIASFPARLGAQEGRTKPLVGLPLVGTGHGGFENNRGELIKALVPALRLAAGDADIDVALVLDDARDYAAVQSIRGNADWKSFTEDELTTADDLGGKAARGELSLFLGAGVSMPLGLPDWKGLLENVAGTRIDEFEPARAPEIAGKWLEILGPERLYEGIADQLTVSGFAAGHLLLADLGVTQTVTTNYDNAYENALDGAHGRQGYRVLTKQLAVQPEPWVLKIHGDVTRPRSMVITNTDYDELPKDERKALLSIIDSLLLTSHLMFVGYSMGDSLFLDAADRVDGARHLSEDRPLPDVATVLALHSEAVLDRPGFRIRAMSPESAGNQVAARRLEIFLDRIAWAATREGRGALAYLLDTDYEDLFADDPQIGSLRAALKEVSRLAQRGPTQGDNLAWDRINQFLREIGAISRPWRTPQEHRDFHTRRGQGFRDRDRARRTHDQA